ncbi:MAG: hypothetical protein ACI8WB_000695 [Phenylobacterium sp.]|jgi:hypothetical protein
MQPLLGARPDLQPLPIQTATSTTGHQMNYGLQKIIILDSFLPGKRILMDVDGHTNLNGTNASGKTTTLRLVRLFYGESPVDICRRKGAVKDAFVSYYLPRASSYIIYQYQNHDGIKHVACFSRSEGINYLLVDKPFDINDYARISDDGEVVPISCVDILREHKLKGYKPKALSSPSHYRKIILGTVKPSERDLIAHRLKYSLAAPGKNLAHLDKVVGTTLEKNRDFDNIKLMLSSVMLDGHSDVVDFKIDASEMEKWRADSSAIRSYEQYLPKLNQLREQLSQHQTSLAQLQTAKYSLQHYQNQFEAQKKQSSQAKFEHEARLDVNANHFSSLRNDFESSRSELNVTIKTLERNIAQLDDEKLDWEDQGIGELQSDLAVLPAKQNNLHNAQQQLDLLMDVAQDIEKQFDQLRQKVQENFYKNNDKLQSQLTAAKEQKSAADIKLAEAKATLSNKFSELKSTRQNDFSDQLTEAEKQLAVLQEQSRHLRASDDTSNLLQSVERDISEQNQQNKILLQQLNTTSRENNQALNHRRHCEQAHRDSGQALTAYQNQQVEFSNRLSPEKDTLRAFLTDHVDSWSGTIGRVIKADLLDAKSLNPVLADDANNCSFYGVNLDLSTLSNEHDKTTEALHAELESLVNTIEAETQRHKSAEHSFVQANKAIEEAELSLAQVNASITSKESLLAQLNDQQQQLKQQQKNEIKQKRLQLDKSLKSAEKQLKLLKQQKQEALEQLKERFMEQGNDLVSAHSGEMAEVSELIDGLSQHISELSQQRKNQIKQLDKDRNTMLADKNVDVSRIKSIEQEIKSLKSFINKMEGAEDKVKRYLSWEKISYSQLGEMQQQLSQQRDQREQISADFNQAERQFKSDKISLGEQLTQNKKQLKDAINQLAEIEPLFNKLADINHLIEDDSSQNNSGEHDTILNYSALMGHVSEHIDLKFKSADKISKLVANFITHLKDHYNSQLHHAITEADMNNLDDHSRIALASFLINDLPATVNDIKLNVIDLANVRGLALSSLYSQLDSQRRVISAFGKTLNQTIKAKTVFSALSLINVYLEPVVDKLDFFKDLQRFKTEFEKWREDDVTALPGLEFEHLMSLMLERFRTNRVTTKHSSLYDIVFEAEVNGKVNQARTASELEDISSQGMGYLILLALMISVGSMIKGNQPVTVHYPVDELGEIHLDNIKAMFDILNAGSDVLVSALPNSDKNLLNMYRNRYRIDRSANCFETTVVQQDSVLALASRQSATPSTKPPTTPSTQPEAI